MGMSLAKIAPSAIMMAAVGYCCWPYLEQPSMTTGPKEPSKPIEISDALLSPEIGTKNDRDPFGVKGLAQADDKGKGADKNKPGADGKGPGGAKPDAEKLAGDKKPLTAAELEAERLAAAKKALAEVEEAVQKLTLNATYISTRQRTAIINSRLYTEGEFMRHPDEKIKSMLVAKVLPHKVVMQLNGLSVDLGYPNPKQKPKSSGKVAPKQQPKVQPTPAPHAPSRVARLMIP